MILINTEVFYVTFSEEKVTKETVRSTERSKRRPAHTPIGRFRQRRSTEGNPKYRCVKDCED